MILSFEKMVNFGCSFILVAVIVFSQNIYAKEKNSVFMGAGMAGHGMMGMCSPLSSIDNIKTNITETSDGVTITYTAKNKKDISRIQKIAKMNKLSQELNEEE